MKKKLILTVIAVGIVVTIACVSFSRLQTKKNELSHSGELTVYGNVDIRQVDLSFRVEGRIDKVNFEEGDLVKRGDLIAVLDRKPFEDDLSLQSAELGTAEADFRLYKAGYREQDVKAAKADVDEKKTTLDNLQIEFNRRQALVSDGAVSKQSFDDIKARRDEAQAKLDSAKEQLSKLEEGYRKEEVEKTAAQVDAKKAQIQISKTRLGDTELFAPSAGTVLTRALEPGSMAHVGQTIMTLSLLDPVWVRAYISEPDLAKVFPGRKAEVYIDGDKKKHYTGHIGYVSPEAEFTPKSVETPELRTRLVYRFRVVVDNPDNGLRQGMPVTVKLLDDKNNND